MYSSSAFVRLSTLASIFLHTSGMVRLEQTGPQPIVIIYTAPRKQCLLNECSSMHHPENTCNDNQDGTYTCQCEVFADTMEPTAFVHFEAHEIG